MSWDVTERGIQRYFGYALDGFTAASWVSAISDEFMSDQETEKYPFLGTPPPMQVWEGTREHHEAQEYDFSITNVLYESSMILPGRLVERNKFQQVERMLDQFARRRAEHWMDLLISQIEDTTSTGYDGSTLFADAHSSRNSGSQDNNISYNVTTPADPTADEAASAIIDAVEAIVGFKDDQGKPMNESAESFLVLAPVQHAAGMWGAFGLQTVTSGGSAITNPLTSLSGFRVELAISPRLAQTDEFFVFRTDGPTKALIRQEEDGTDSGLTILGRDSEFWFDNYAMKIGTSVSRNTGIGAWQNACKVTLT